MAQPYYLQYREWVKDGDISLDKQVEPIKILTRPFEAATTVKKELVVMGDMNLCANKWNKDDFFTVKSFIGSFHV